MFKRLLSPPEQSRAAKTVEIYGWIIFAEGGLLLLFPDFMARLMHFGPLTQQASGFLRLIGMLVSGFGMLYLLSERLTYNSRSQRLFDSNEFVAEMFQLNFKRRGPNS